MKTNIIKRGIGSLIENQAQVHRFQQEPHTLQGWENVRKISRALLVFPAVILIYIILYHSFYFELYPLSTIDPYLYYAYSPGFWSVDLSFWLFTPLYYLWFRRNKESAFISLLYAFCLDASAVGTFLIFFDAVYGINPFTSAYYTYAFVLMLLFIVPIFHMHFSKQNIIFFLVFPVVGAIWKLTGANNVGYFISSSVIIDLFMIFYCFFFMFTFRNVSIRRVMYEKN